MRQTYEMREWDNHRAEEKKCTAGLSVWVIVKDGVSYGRITVRNSRSGNASSITLTMHRNGGATEIAGYERIPSIKPDWVDSGIAKLLMRHKEKLITSFKFRLPDSAETLSKSWRQYIEFSGYKAIQAL